MSRQEKIEEMERRFNAKYPNAFEKMQGGMLAMANLVEGILPQPSPGRGKRQAMTDDERWLFADAVESFHAEKPVGHVTSFIAEAFKTGNRRTFEIISEAADYAKNTPRTQFSETVISARKSALVLKAKIGHWPTKLEVKKAVIERMKSATFGAEESSRWTEVFKTAQLGFLPTGKPSHDRR